MLADKAVNDILHSLIGITKDIIVTEPDNPRKMKAEELAERLKSMGVEPDVAPSPEDSLALAESRKNCCDVILFAGSLYLISDIRRMIKDGGR